jgi:hypothetical protein
MVTLRIESESRWDALALTRRLDRYHWFLVAPDPSHWDVYVPLGDEPRPQLPGDLQERIVDWLNEREIDEVAVHTEADDMILTRPSTGDYVVRR